MNKKIFPFLIILAFFAACSDDENKKTSGAILLGDTATIVTENDSRNLGDFVADVKVKEIEKKHEEEEKQQEAQQGAETNASLQQEQAPAQPVVNGKGLQIDFKDIQVFIPGIATKSFTNQNPEKSGGASYQLTSGNLKGNQLTITGATVTKITQRTIAYVLASNELGKLRLLNLGATSDWKEINGRNGAYPIMGMNAHELVVKPTTPAALKNAVMREAKRSRCSRKTIQAWAQSIGNNPTLNRPPFTTEVRSILWKIEGKNAKGSAFIKQLRIDFPI